MSRSKSWSQKRRKLKKWERPARRATLTRKDIVRTGREKSLKRDATGGQP